MWRIFKNLRHSSFYAHTHLDGPRPGATAHWDKLPSTMERRGPNSALTQQRCSQCLRPALPAYANDSAKTISEMLHETREKEVLWSFVSARNARLLVSFAPGSVCSREWLSSATVSRLCRDEIFMSERRVYSTRSESSRINTFLRFKR